MKLDLSYFDVDISRMNVLQLADWLVACRKEAERRDNETDSEYYERLKVFCDAWEKHYNKYVSIYSSETFYITLAYVPVKDNITLVTKTRNEVVRCPIGGCEALNAITIDRGLTIEKIEEKAEDYYTSLDIAFSERYYSQYKERLHDYIEKERFSTIEYERFFEYTTLMRRYTANTYDELTEWCQRTPHEINIHSEYKRNNYEKGLREFDVIKSVYSYFRRFDLCEKEFGKKMFVNLAFALGMSLPHLEKLLEYNGYSLSVLSFRKFDKIVRDAFKCGFSREMTIGLIGIEKAKGYNIPNLTSNSKEK